MHVRTYDNRSVTTLGSFAVGGILAGIAIIAGSAAALDADSSSVAATVWLVVGSVVLGTGGTASVGAMVVSALSYDINFRARELKESLDDSGSELSGGQK